MRTRRQQSAFTGQAGLYAVASRLSLLNHSVYIPSVDEGVDIMLGNGLRIQVKCRHIARTKGVSGRSYTVPLWKKKKYRKGKDYDITQCYTDAVDFVIFWAIEDNRFFVFPAAEVTCAVWIPSKMDNFSNRARKTNNVSAPLITQFEEAWHLLDMDAAVQSLEDQAAEVAQVIS